MALLQINGDDYKYAFSCRLTRQCTEEGQVHPPIRGRADGEQLEDIGKAPQVQTVIISECEGRNRSNPAISLHLKSMSAS